VLFDRYSLRLHCLPPVCIGKQIAHGSGLNRSFGGNRLGDLIASTYHLFEDGHTETSPADDEVRRLMETGRMFMDLVVMSSACPIVSGLIRPYATNAVTKR